MLDRGVGVAVEAGLGHVALGASGELGPVALHTSLLTGWTAWTPELASLLEVAAGSWTFGAEATWLEPSLALGFDRGLGDRLTIGLAGRAGTDGATAAVAGLTWES